MSRGLHCGDQARADLSGRPPVGQTVLRDLPVLPTSRPADHGPHGHHLFQRRPVGLRKARAHGPGGGRVPRVEDRVGPHGAPLEGETIAPSASSPTCLPTSPRSTIALGSSITPCVCCASIVRRQCAVWLRLPRYNHSGLHPGRPGLNEDCGRKQPAPRSRVDGRGDPPSRRVELCWR